MIRLLNMFFSCVGYIFDDDDAYNLGYENCQIHWFQMNSIMRMLTVSCQIFVNYYIYQLVSKTSVCKAARNALDEQRRLVNSNHANNSNDVDYEPQSTARFVTMTVVNIRSLFFFFFCLNGVDHIFRYRYWKRCL